MFSRFEIFGGIAAVLVIVVMGIIVFTGPYHKVNKPVAAATGPPVSISIVNDPKTVGRYTPASETVHVGQPVTFKNVSGFVHSVTARNGSFNQATIPASGGSWRYIPHQPGTFKYYCIYHPFMHGVLTVTS